MRRGIAGLVAVGVVVGGCTAAPVPQETPLGEATLTIVVPEETGPSEVPLRSDGSVDSASPRSRDLLVGPLRPDGSTVAERLPGPTGAASLLGGLLTDDERFGAVRLDGSGTVLLAWHGDPPQEALAAVAEAYPDVLVRVEPLDVLPGELQGLAESLLGDDRWPQVRAVHVRDDLSSIVVQVGVEPNPLTLAARLTAEVGFPVEVEVAASR
ncbi:amino acid kinase family protein [Oerskovia rustica]|uniref:Uncharacterized protein n=1 Tax=Oerskovia rustica TaxID=2762237 RepID=A0ABR8RU79_9CELL|nr:hypothetical protein [Oerskovia rustica]MBD7951347.1 hypothetical protein [Oerskovia rustica]